MFFDYFQRETVAQWIAFFNPTERVYFFYLLSSVILALIAWRLVEHDHDHDHEISASKEAAGRGKRPFLTYVFDWRVWGHFSSIQDYKFFAINALIYYGLVAQFLIGVDGAAWAFHGAMNKVLGTLDAPLISGFPAMALYTIVSVLAFDFGIFISHYLFHKIPFFWAFHKVHHSAETPNPMTLFRVHPVDLFFTGVVVALMSGVTFAGFFYLTGTKPTEFTIFGLNIIVFCFYLIGYNLRHSHMWVRYPVWVSHIFVSPAQHQIHHSADPKHWDRNMGLIFAFWDKLFGTLYVPHAFEKLTFGINQKVPNPFATVGSLYWTPFKESYQALKESFPDRARGRLAVAGIGALCLIYAGAYLTMAGQAPGFHMRSVELADLTWMEVDAALKHGYDTAIVPTGGTEQNGPYVALGKHNFIVKATSAEIARRAGKTLVAPVIAYVPEGAIEPTPEGWMTYAGTLSVPEPVFEAVLDATARSLKSHGFKKILLMGDSGGNQQAQDRVARKLSDEWGGDGVMVVNLREYYDDNGQVAFLKSKGYTDGQIGSHAGIRDTSELMFIERPAVRLQAYDERAYPDPGVLGAPGMANARLGEQMLILKVNAAMKAIDKVNTAWNLAYGEKSRIDPTKTAATGAEATAPASR